MQTFFRIDLESTGDDALFSREGDLAVFGPFERLCATRDDAEKIVAILSEDVGGARYIVREISAQEVIDCCLRWCDEGEGHNAFAWAFDGVNSFVEACPEISWPIILQLVAKAQSDKSLSVIAAGPLENLLCSHGRQFIERILYKAREDQRFRMCLRAVWGANRMDPGIRTQVCDATKDIPKW